MIKKLLMSVLAILVIAGLCSCSKDSNKRDSSTLNINVAMLNHVVNGEKISAPFSTPYSFRLNRQDNKVEISGAVRLADNASLSDFTLRDIPVKYNPTRDYYTFTADRVLPSSGDMGGVITNLSGVIDYNNSVFSVSYTVNGQTTVNATLSSLYYQSTTNTAVDASGSSFSIDNVAYEFAIDSKTMTAKLGIYDVRFSSSMPLISRLEYEGLKVSTTTSGYKITGNNLVPTNTKDGTNIKSFPLTSIDADFNLAGGTFMASYTTSGYTVTASGSSLMK